MNSIQSLQVLLSLLLQSTLLILFVWRLRASLSNSSSRVRLWTSLYVSLLIMGVAAICLPRLQWLYPWKNVAPQTLVNVLQAEHTIGVTMLAVWLIGVLVICFYRLAGMFRLQRLIAGCRTVTSQEQTAIELALQADSELGSCSPDLLSLSIDDRRIEFRVGCETYGPFCYQLHYPVVVLPVSLLSGEPADLRNVLIHELTHLRSRHALQIFLEKTLQTVFWFQPLCWLSARHAALDREFQCDDASTTTREATIGYLKTLIRVVENRVPQEMAVMPLNRQPSQLLLRAQRLAKLGPQSKSRAIPCSRVLVVLAALTCSQFWLPLNPLAAPNDAWSAWPSWSAAVLHELGVTAPDYENFNPRTDLYEVIRTSSQTYSDTIRKEP